MTSPKRVAKVKNSHPPKTCRTCHREFEWRKKWERDWDNVHYCSQACRGKRGKEQA